MKQNQQNLAVLTLASCLAGAALSEPSFNVSTIPSIAGLSANVKSIRVGDEWRLAVTAKNTTDTNMTFKLVLEASPGFAATKYLIPGVMYDGNKFVQAMTGDCR